MSEICEQCQQKMGGILFGEEKASVTMLNFLKKINYGTLSLCRQCARKEIDKYFDPEKLQHEINELKKTKEENIQCFQDIISNFKLHISDTYEGEPLGPITGYSALGTGLLTEIASTFTDAFGVQSASYKEKLNESEEAAKQDIIQKAFNMGATSIYSLKFQITEATSGSGILICYFYGMAVKENITSEKFSNYYEIEHKFKEKLIKLKEYKKLITCL